MRLGLLMRRMVLDWTLSRRKRVDFGAPTQKWEQYSKEGRTWDFHMIRNDDSTVWKRHLEVDEAELCNMDIIFKHSFLRFVECS